MMTPDQALTGLGAVVGGGGLSAIIVSVMGYLTEARKGRHDPMPIIEVGGALTSHRWDELAAESLATIAGCMPRLVAILELDAEERFPGKDFHDRLDMKVMAAFTRAIKEASRD